MSTSGRSLVGAGTVGVLSSGLLGLSLLTGSLDEPAPTAPVGGGTVVAGAIPAQYVAVVNAAGTRCEAFPAPVIAAQVQTESGWNPRAMSPAGAQGISQFMPGTWTKWGHDWTGDGVADVWFPSDAIPSQASFDCALAQRMQSALSAGLVGGATATDLALAAYNAGPGAVMAAHGIPQNGETPAYVARIEKVAASFSATAQSAPAGPFGAAVVAAARTRLGLPYVWGGGTANGPSGSPVPGFDCSGLVLWAVHTASGGAITLPHSADQQSRMGVPVASGVGSTIDMSALQPGDTVGFQLHSGGVYDHIGIYLGNGVLLNASHPGADGGVKLESLRAAYWQRVPWSVRRFG